MSKLSIWSLVVRQILIFVNLSGNVMAGERGPRKLRRANDRGSLVVGAAAVVVVSSAAFVAGAVYSASSSNYNDTKQETAAYASDLSNSDFNDDADLDLFSNNLNKSRNYYLSNIKYRAIEGISQGKSKSQVKEHTRDRVDQIVSDQQTKLAKQWTARWVYVNETSHQFLQAADSRSNTQGLLTLRASFNDSATVARISWDKDTHLETSNLTLANGSNITYVTGIDDARCDASGQSAVEDTANGAPICQSVQKGLFNPGWSENKNYASLRLTYDFDSDGSKEVRFPVHISYWHDVRDNYQKNYDEMRQIGDNLSTKMFDLYQAGDINLTEFVDPYQLAQLGASGDFSARFLAANAAAQGYSTNLTAQMQIETKYDNSTNITYEGTLYTDASKFTNSTLKAGKTYVLGPNETVFFAAQTSDGGSTLVRIQNQSFRVNWIVNRSSGENLSSTHLDDYRVNKSVGNLTQLKEDLRDSTEAVKAAEEAQSPNVSIPGAGWLSDKLGIKEGLAGIIIIGGVIFLLSRR